MNICLIRPPALVDKEGFAIDPVPPLGLAYIAGAIEASNHKVSVIDAVGESPKQFNKVDFKLNITNEYKSGRLFSNGLSNQEIADRIPSDADVIGLSCMFSNNWLTDRELIRVLHEAHPKKMIIAGGESITSIPELWLKQAPGLKICVLGEGEETIVELLDALDAKINLKDIPGIAFKDEKSDFFINSSRSRIKDISSIPKPYWDLFPIKNYHDFKLQYTVTENNSFPVLATRGCPYRCTFCSNPKMWGTRYFMRKPEDVVDEIEDIINKHNVYEFDFYDLTAIIRKKWIIEFAKEIDKRKLKIRWNMPAGTRSEAIDEEVAMYLNLSGCKNITYAPESGSEKMLELIQKKVSLPQMLKSMAASNRNGMRIYINLILALPGETHKDIWKTLWFLVKCSWVGVYEIGVAMFHPYPGSELFDKLLKEGKINLDNDDFFYNTITISPVKKSDFHYNENVSDTYYKYYNILAYIVFFSSNYLFRPIRFFRLLKNVITKNPYSRFERTLSGLLFKDREESIKKSNA